MRLQYNNSPGSAMLLPQGSSYFHENLTKIVVSLSRIYNALFNVASVYGGALRRYLGICLTVGFVDVGIKLKNIETAVTRIAIR